jgi:hypothetical protein
MSAPQGEDPFYVGYHPVAPGPVARGLQHIVGGIVILVAAAAALLALSQRPAEPGVFEYGHPRTVRGQLREFPYPSLLVPGTGITDRGTAYTRYLLVAAGKHGAQTVVSGLDGRWVELTGTRIARPEREMLEVTSGGVAELSPASIPEQGVSPPPAADLGERTLTGEIVDSKCWLGVMKPATGNVHRGCASRCLHGGIPPLLMTTDSLGGVAHYLLTDADGRAAPVWFSELVGREVRLTGEVNRDGDLLILRVRHATVIWR